MKFCFLYLMGFGINCAGNIILPPKVDRHQSPLDESEGSGVGVEPSFWVHGAEYAAGPPSCKSMCVTKVLDVLTIYFRSGTFKENMRKACRDYDDATACMLNHRHCGSDLMFESITSGLRYMCKEQREAFNALVDCIDANNARVNQDCDQQCHPDSLATGIVVKNTVMNQLEHPLVSKNVNMRRIIEPHMSRLFFSHGCKIAQCLMTCTRTKYNMLCEGTAGSLLLEMLTLPLSARDSASFPSGIHLTSFLGGLLPYQCSFLTAPEGKRGSFRIDPELDKEIKRMYSDKNRTSSVALPSPLSQPVEVENPFLKIPNVFHQESPFDNPEVNEKLLRSAPFPQDANDVEESSGNADISLSQNVNDNEGGAVSTSASSTAIAESDILLTDDQAKPLSENRVEAGNNYTIYVPRQSNVRDHTKVGKGIQRRCTRCRLLISRSTSGGELVCYIDRGTA